MRRSSDGFSLSIGSVGRQVGASIERAGGTWVPASRMWALCCLFVCSSACDSCNDDQGPSGTPAPTDAGPQAGSAGGSGRTDGGGMSGNTGGVSGGVSGAGMGGVSGFSGIGGDPGFMMPTCFDCGNGCFDCGNGAGCACMGEFVPAPWQPPFTAIGSTGWKDSTKPFCGGIQQSGALDLWADSTGVYALVVGQGQPLNEDVMDDDAGVASTTVNGQPSNMFGPVGGFRDGQGFPGMKPDEGGPLTRIWHNDGRGWALRAEGVGGSALSGLTGIERGPLIMFSNSLPEEFACRLGMTTRGGFNCYDVDPVQDVVVVNSSLAYALMGSFLGGTRLLVFDGTTWRNHPTLIPYPVLRLWADGTHVIAIGTAGTLLRLQGDKWELEDVGVLEGLTSIWGPSIDDLWLGTNSGKVLHHDGNGWKLAFQIAGKTCDARQPVIGLWGAGGTMYAHSPTALVRWKDGVLTTLGNWTCGLGTSQQVRSIWGRSENELFVGLMDATSEIQCGASYVAYFDGTEFHRM